MSRRHDGFMPRVGDTPFSQALILPSGMSVYIDPSASDKVALSGSDVDSITSQVGTDVVANTLTNRPTYAATGLGGRPAVLCASASTQYLVDDTSSGAAVAADNGAFSLYFAVSPSNVTSKQFINFKNNSPNNFIQIGTNAGGSLRFARGAGGVTVNDIVGSALSIAAHYISIVYNGTNVSAWVDGVVSINNVAAAADVNAITGLVYGSGWFGTVPSQPMDGHLGKMMLWPTAHSTANRTLVEAWLKAYYQL
jgi:hypothetical protein